jgi:hypothetical protein
MKKIPIEVLHRADDRITVVIPDSLNPLQLVGIAEQLLMQLGVPSVKIVVGALDETQMKLVDETQLRHGS